MPGGSHFDSPAPDTDLSLFYSARQIPQEQSHSPHLETSRSSPTTVAEDQRVYGKDAKGYQTAEDSIVRTPASAVGSPGTDSDTLYQLLFGAQASQTHPKTQYSDVNMSGGSHFDSPAPDTDLPWFDSARQIPQEQSHSPHLETSRSSPTTVAEDQRVYGKETVIQFEALFTSMLRERTNNPNCEVHQKESKTWVSICAGKSKGRIAKRWLQRFEDKFRDKDDKIFVSMEEVFDVLLSLYMNGVKRFADLTAQVKREYTNISNEIVKDFLRAIDFFWTPGFPKLPGGVMFWNDDFLIRLSTLNLSHTNLNTKDAVDLSNHLDVYRTSLQNLKVLDVSDNTIKGFGVISLLYKFGMGLNVDILDTKTGLQTFDFKWTGNSEEEDDIIIRQSTKTFSRDLGYHVTITSTRKDRTPHSPVTCIPPPQDAFDPSCDFQRVSDEYMNYLSDREQEMEEYDPSCDF